MKPFRSGYWLLGILMLASVQLWGQNRDWDGGAANSQWGRVNTFFFFFPGSSNWSGSNTEVPNTDTEIARFLGGVTGNLSIPLTGSGFYGVGPTGGAYTINGITVDTGNTVTLDFGNQARFDLAGINPQISMAGSDTVNFDGVVRFDASGSITQGSSGDLNFNNQLDINAALTVNHSGPGAANFNGAIALNADLSINQSSSATTTFAGSIIGGNDVLITGSGGVVQWSMGAGQVSVNDIQIDGGTLILGANNQISGSTGLTLNGGTFSTGGFDSSTGSLTLSSTSTVDLGVGGSVISFSGGSRTGGVLTVTSWSGSWQGGGSDQIVFGNSLSQSFLDNVFWQDLGLYGARQLASGEIVPIPEPSTYAIGTILLGLVCYGERRRRSNGNRTKPRAPQRFGIVRGANARSFHRQSTGT